MKLKPLFAAALLVAATNIASAQKVWTLQECIDYAMENNIALQMSQISYQSGLEDTEQAKASMLPTVSASSSQGLSNYPSGNNNTYTGSYGINANMTIFNGGKLRNAYKQAQAYNTIDSLAVEQSKMELKAEITQAYINCLYAKEAVTAAKSTALASQAQRDRGEQMKNAGSISRVDLAQLESQYYSDNYQITVAENSLESYKLQLKQLLELDIMEDIEVSEFEASDEEVLAALDPKSTVYANALENLPQIKSGEYELQAAELSQKQAEAGVLPTIGLNAGIGSGNNSVSNDSFGDQLKNNFNESIGASISIPIFSARQNRTAINKAKLAYQNAELSRKNTEKTVLKTVESTYLNAISSQGQFVAAREKEKYAQESYELTSEQFKVGRRNIVELITAQNELTNATQSAIQAKYTALLNMRMLDIYQGKL